MRRVLVLVEAAGEFSDRQEAVVGDANSGAWDTAAAFDAIYQVAQAKGIEVEFSTSPDTANDTQ